MSCEYCNSPIAHKGNKRFCSRKCYLLASCRKPKKCEQCGELYTNYKSSLAAKRRFCSLDCSNAARLEGKYSTSLQAIPQKQNTCKQCGKTFITECQSRTDKQKYCSRECGAIGKRKPPLLFVCKRCGKTFTRSRKKGYASMVVKYCSRDCQYASQRGESSHFWKGGCAGYRGGNWHTQRKLALERDNSTCQHCHTSQKLVVHHIIPHRLFDGDHLRANDLENLITLCRLCHKKAEPK